MTKENQLQFLLTKLVDLEIGKNDPNKFTNALIEIQIEQIKEEEKYKNKICPKCARLSLYHRGSFNTWRCAKCYSTFSFQMDFLGLEKPSERKIIKPVFSLNSTIPEISDQEIERCLEDMGNYAHRRDYFIKGAKWYREQLKQIQ
jgi:ribosomal protein S27AE